jgi:hypothetical protein
MGVGIGVPIYRWAQEPTVSPGPGLLARWSKRKEPPLRLPVISRVLCLVELRLDGGSVGYRALFSGVKARHSSSKVSDPKMAGEAGLEPATELSLIGVTDRSLLPTRVLSNELAAPGGIAPPSPGSEPGILLLNEGAMWSGRLDLHQHSPLSESGRLTLILRPESWLGRRDLNSHNSPAPNGVAYQLAYDPTEVG